MSILDDFKNLLGIEAVEPLIQIGAILKGAKIVHINSTKYGGGVAEILTKLVPLTSALGIDCRWEVINGNEGFYSCTKMFHNLLQGLFGVLPSQDLLREYEKTNERNAEELRSILEDADIVFIHDPQPLPLINYFPNRKGKWIWRCHIDCSHPDRAIWRYLRKFIEKYDASIFSLEEFARNLPHPIFIMPPSIDPFSEKNIELDQEEVKNVFHRFKIDPEKPNILQVSRFDRFKDPIGVIESYRYTKKFFPALQLILAGGGATDDPEGDIVLKEVNARAKDDKDIHILYLPPDSHRIINALQRGADIVVQKSIREGFGLTVTEALWKSKPVIGGNTGGIRIQILNYHNGFLVNTPEGAAHRIRYLLQNYEKVKEMGANGKKMVRDHFLITRNLRDYLALICSLLHQNHEQIDLSKNR